MLEWLAKNWGWFLATLACGAYFAFYVLAAREQRGAPRGERRLPKDNC